MDARAGPSTLTELVIEAASSLTTVSPSTLVEACELVLQRLVSYFGVDVSYVRRNDHELGATVLLAEWPPRTDVPSPDPLGVVFFADGDPVFTALRDLTEVLVVRPDVENALYQERVHQGSGVLGVSSVSVPMMGQDVTTGVLGLLKFGDRGWTPTEITALTAMAALLAQAMYRVTAEAQLRYLAYHDELTGLYNRRALLDHLAARLEPAAAGSSGPAGGVGAMGLVGAPDASGPAPPAGASGPAIPAGASGPAIPAGASGPAAPAGSVALLFLDLDRLKAMNDLLGHAAGDHFLRNLTQRLQREGGPGDFLARFGGDELVMVLGGLNERAAALQVAERIRRVVAAPVSLDDNEVSRTVSVGVAVGRPGEYSVSALLAQAAQAAVAAKSAGGNQVVEFTEQMRIDNGERADVELRLRDAIAQGQLRLHYQPQIDLVTGELVGAEALVRWLHPTRGLLPPSDFVEVAELTNLSGELGRWVLDDACAQLARWQQDYDLSGFCLGVNVSAAQLITVDLAADVAATLRRNQVDARNVTLEITETAVVADIGRARETLLALTELGVHLAIDDFGTGYSSFAQLKTLPVETLKIDRGFVTNLADNHDDQAIVRSIIGLATSFGLQTMAEGVETAEAVTALLELGCHRAQGYLIGRPKPPAELTAFLDREQARKASTTPGA